MQAEIDAGQRKRRTLIDYKPVVARYLKPFFSSKPIDGISKHDVSEYAAWRRDYWLNGDGSRLDKLEFVRNGETKRRKRVQKHAAPSARTLSKENVALRGIFKHAVDKGWVAEAQVPKIKSPRITTSMTRERARPILRGPSTTNCAGL